MPLRNELKLNKPFTLEWHEELLNICLTSARNKKRGAEFLKPHGLTDVQFNLMLLLKHQPGEEEGLSQARISEMMLVNRANITSLIDRMEKAGYVVRTAADGDRRYNIIKLTAKGRKLTDKVEPIYAKEVTRIMSPLNKSERLKLTAMLEKIRAGMK